MPGIKETITRPVGPLPAFAWVLVIVGGYFGYKFLSGRGGSVNTTPAATGNSGIPVDASGYQQTIQDLINRIPVPPVSTPPDGVVTPPIVQAAPVGLISAYMDKVTGQLGLSTGSIYSMLPNNNGPTSWIDTNGSVVAIRNPVTGQIRFTNGSIFNQIPGTDFNYITGVIQTLGSPAAAPQFDTSTVNTANTALSDLQNVAQPSIPTYSNANTSSQSLNIPAMTP